MEHHTRKGLFNRSSSAYLRAKEKTFYKKSIQAYAAHTLVQGHYLQRPSSKDSIGLRISKMQKKLSRHVRHARAPPLNSQNLRLLYNSSHPPGPCKDGAWTLFGHYHHHRGNKFAVVAIEYFTRWIEAKLLATITSEIIKEF